MTCDAMDETGPLGHYTRLAFAPYLTGRAHADDIGLAAGASG